MFRSLNESKPDVIEKTITSGSITHFKQNKVILSGKVEDDANIQADGEIIFKNTVGNNVKLTCKGAPEFHADVGDNINITCDKDPVFHARRGKDSYIKTKDQARQIVTIKDMEGEYTLYFNIYKPRLFPEIKDEFTEDMLKYMKEFEKKPKNIDRIDDILKTLTKDQFTELEKLVSIVSPPEVPCYIAKYGKDHIFDAMVLKNRPSWADKEGKRFITYFPDGFYLKDVIPARDFQNKLEEFLKKHTKVEATSSVSLPPPGGPAF